MVDREIEIVNRLGLHARAAAKFVHLAGRFKSRITIRSDGREVDGKSILGILLLAAARGMVLRIACDGADEQDALGALCALIEEKFGEGS